MEYISCSAAQNMPGLRVALSRAAPGPWGEAAKAILYVRKVSYVPVAQEPFADNDELCAWTGQRNAPVAIYNGERARHTWIDILHLAERLGSGPSLLPVDREEQVDCIGLSHQLLGEGGLCWNRRLALFSRTLASVGGDASKAGLPARMISDYRADKTEMARADAHILTGLALFERRLASQWSSGSKYLVGNFLSAADIYFANMLGMFDPLPHHQFPLPKYMRDLYSSGDEDVRAAITSRLKDHRDFIYDKHLKLPIDF